MFLKSLKFPSMSSTFCLLPSPSSDIKPFNSAKRRSWKKPKDKPKRPLSAYNLFFQHEREKIIASLPESKESVQHNRLTEDERRRKHRKTHGKIGFADLARSIAHNWRMIDKPDRSMFEARADIEKARYKKELDVWKKTQTDGRERTETVEKKKKTPSVPMASTQSEALASLLASNNSAQQAQMAQFMMNNQALAQQFQQQNTNGANVYQTLMASSYERLLHRQRGNFEQPRHLSQPNNFCVVNSVPQMNQLNLMYLAPSPYATRAVHQPCAFEQRRLSQPNNFCVNSVPQVNQLNMVNMASSADLTSPSYTASAVHQRRAALPSDSFLTERVFFEDAADTASPEVFSDTESELSLKEDIDAFIDDFGPEILLH